LLQITANRPFKTLPHSTLYFSPRRYHQITVSIRLTCQRIHIILIGTTSVGTGGDWYPTFRLGTNNVLIPQLVGRSFQKVRYISVFTANSHQNAGFSN